MQTFRTIDAAESPACAAIGGLSPLPPLHNRISKQIDATPSPHPPHSTRRGARARKGVNNGHDHPFARPDPYLPCSVRDRHELGTPMYQLHTWNTSTCLGCKDRSLVPAHSGPAIRPFPHGTAAVTRRAHQLPLCIMHNDQQPRTQLSVATVDSPSNLILLLHYDALCDAPRPKSLTHASSCESCKPKCTEVGTMQDLDVLG